MSKQYYTHQSRLSNCTSLERQVYSAVADANVSDICNFQWLADKLNMPASEVAGAVDQLISRKLLVSHHGALDVYTL